MMHHFPGIAHDFERRLQLSELEYLAASENARRTMAEGYVGPST
jgi:p-hydroxybenzoate 3-monooxygenase